MPTQERLAITVTSIDNLLCDRHLHIVPHLILLANLQSKLLSPIYRWQQSLREESHLLVQQVSSGVSSWFPITPLHLEAGWKQVKMKTRKEKWQRMCGEGGGGGVRARMGWTQGRSSDSRLQGQEPCIRGLSHKEEFGDSPELPRSSWACRCGACLSFSPSFSSPFLGEGLFPRQALPHGGSRPHQQPQSQALPA